MLPFLFVALAAEPFPEPPALDAESLRRIANVEQRLVADEARLAVVEARLGIKPSGASAAAVPPATVGSWTAVDTSGIQIAQPTAYYYATPQGAVMGFYGEGGGSCANGQCGGSSGGRRGLFGRRR